MKKIIAIISGVILTLGCIMLGISILIASVAPNIFLVYLTANPSSFSHDVLYPNMTIPYIFSTVEIVLGLFGVFYCNGKARD